MTDPQSEFVERYAERGPKGDKGDRGEGGRLPSGTARSVVILFLIGFAIGVANLLFTVHYIHAQQHAERQAGQIVERKLCKTFGELAANKPPAGDAAANPSRAYEQRNHRILAGVGPDIGCGGGR